MLSPYGQEFRQLMDTWDKHKITESIEATKSRIKNIIDGNRFILFLKKEDDDDVFGADEEGRLMFARMKNPNDEELPDGWEKDANFSCTNLSKVVGGDPQDTLFSMKDMPSLQVLDDKENIIDMLLKALTKGSKVDVKPAKNKKDGGMVMKEKP